MRKIFVFIFLLAFTVLLTRCDREKTTWYPEFAAPVAYGTLDFSDFEDNDYLVDDGGVIAVHYYDTLEPINLTELVNLGDTVLSAIYGSPFAFGPFPFESGNTLFTIPENFDFNLDGAELRNGIIKTGLLKLTFECDVDGYLDLQYLVDGLTLDGVPLSVSALTTPATTEDPFTDEILVDVSGYSIDLTGDTGLDRNKLSAELSVATASSPTYTAQLYGSDAITIEMELLELEVEELRGYFGQWDRELDEEIILDSVIYQSGDFSLGEITANLEFINNYGVDAQIQLSEFTAVNSITLEELGLNASGLTDLHTISRAIETADEVISSEFSIEFDNTSNLAEAISIPPNRFRLVGDAVLNPLGDVTGGFDFYRSEYPFQVVTDIAFPLCLGIENLILQDSIDFALEETDGLESVILVATLSNSFPVGFLFSVRIPGQTDEFWEGEIEASADNTPISHRLEISLSKERIEELKETDKLIIRAVVNTANADEVKLLTSNKLDVLITAEITYEAEL